MLVELLRAFPAREVTRAKFVAEMMRWSARGQGEEGLGDPELHHVVGGVYAEGEFAVRSWYSRLRDFTWIHCSREGERETDPGVAYHLRN